jgi:sigma-E factor negative regulatory protein RseC
VPELNSQNNVLDTGIITSIQGNEALVTIDAQTTCESCGARVLCVPDQSGKRILKASNPLNAKIGTRVAVRDTSTFLLKLSFLQYGIPLLGFLIGIILCYITDVSLKIIAKELVMFGGGVIGLGIGAFVARYFAQRMAENNSAYFTIFRILN